ncbi:hypothetical protein Nepgr_010400 [Nepenthes gracilis]|uniref:RNase H type-1 domain-containing protein n=1 Tax=Nepenthes gracilis TaxID=150966 RepID=A0AAD3SD07_NEPGR|nr:hypothetical protein Nepgr_010400 [Nepenthes gracilis]
MASKWAVELGEFDVEFRPRPALKGQALTKFIVEAATPTLDDNGNLRSMRDLDILVWTMSVDRSSTQAGSGAGVVLKTPDSVKITYSVALTFSATNNVAEYEAILAGFRLAKECSAKTLIQGFDRFLIKHVPRSDNWKADWLARDAAAGSPEQYTREPRETLDTPSIDSSDQEVLQVDVGDNWMTPYRKYLTNETLPDNADEAKRIKKTASLYTLLDGRLYRRGYSTPFLKCLTPEEASLYWPTLKRDAMEFVRKCESYQVHGSMMHLPCIELRSLQSPWPFAQWGLNILRPLPLASGQREFLIVEIDYFTKWIKAVPLA